MIFLFEISSFKNAIKIVCFVILCIYMPFKKSKAWLFAWLPEI